MGKKADRIKELERELEESHNMYCSLSERADNALSQAESTIDNLQKRLEFANELLAKQFLQGAFNTFRQ